MKASFHGHEILIPNNPEIKLSHVYGDDWKVPDPGFDKKSRRDSNIIDHVSLALSNEEVVRSFVKKTEQWKSLSLLKRILVRLVFYRKKYRLGRIIPSKSRIVKIFGEVET